MATRTCLVMGLGHGHLFALSTPETGLYGSLGIQVGYAGVTQ